MSWNFAHDFVLMYYRSSLSVVTLRQFLYARQDVLWYGDVRPSVRVSVRPFSALFSYMLWHIELKFCTWLCSNVLQIKLECRQFASIFVGVMPLLELKILEIHSFPHFSLTCFDILRWNFAYDFVLLYYRSSSNVVNLRQFLWELCPFWNLNYWKYTVSALFSYMLWHIELKFCIWLCFTVLQIKLECRQFASIFVRVMPLLELKLLEIQFSALSPTCFDTLSWNFAHDFVLMYYRSSLSVINLCQFLLELCPFWNLKYCKYTVFRTFLLHALTYWVEILHIYDFVLLYYRSSSSVVNFCVSYAPFGTQNTENIQFSALFSDMLWLIELKICTWLCFTEIKINFDCRQCASIFCGSYAPFGTLNTWNTQFTFLLHALAYWAEIFHVTFFNVLQIKFECCHSVSIHFIWNLKFDVGFFNAFLLEKYSIKIAF